jgi:hypothetical protein
MLMVEPCNRVECSTIDDMVSNVLRIAEYLGTSSLLMTLSFSSINEETQFLCSMHQVFTEDAGKSFLDGTSFVIFQEKGTSALVTGRQCRFVSPDDIERIMQLSSYIAQAGDIFALRNPTNPFIVAYFSSYLNACYRIGLKLVGLITFVDGNFNKEIMF